MEAWAGVKLQTSAVYGVRVYCSGSTLVNHVDRSDSHIIFAILNIDQKVSWGMERVEGIRLASPLCKYALFVG